jgi:hypothetical protein
MKFLIWHFEGWTSQFKDTIKLLKQAELERALKGFKHLLKIKPNDGPCIFFIHLVRRLIVVKDTDVEIKSVRKVSTKKDDFASPTQKSSILVSDMASRGKF